MKRLFRPETAFFLLVWLVLLLAFRERGFYDPGSLWHVKVGEIILDRRDPADRPVQLHVRGPARGFRSSGGRKCSWPSPTGPAASTPCCSAFATGVARAVHARSSGGASQGGMGPLLAGADRRRVPVRRGVPLLRPPAHVHHRVPRLDDDVRRRLRARPVHDLAARGADPAVRAVDEPARRRARRHDDAGAGGRRVGAAVPCEGRAAQGEMGDTGRGSTSRCLPLSTSAPGRPPSPDPGLAHRVPPRRASSSRAC